MSPEFTNSEDADGEGECLIAIVFLRLSKRQHFETEAPHQKLLPNTNPPEGVHEEASISIFLHLLHPLPHQLPAQLLQAAGKIIVYRIGCSAQQIIFKHAHFHDKNLQITIENPITHICVEAIAV